MSNQGTRWPVGLWEQAKALLDAGKTLEEAAREIGVERQRLKAKVRWENISADELERRRARMRDYRRYHRRIELRNRPYNRDATPPRIQFDRPAVPPPPALIAERDYRMSLAPRDLTAALCGDPLPGFSALDRRA